MPPPPRALGHRVRVVQAHVAVFETERGDLLDAAPGQRQVDLAIDAGGGQFRGGEGRACVDRAFRATGQAFVQPGIVGVIVGGAEPRRAPVVAATVGQPERAPQHDVGLRAVQVVQPLEAIGGDAAFAGVDVALAADAGIQLQHVRVVDVVAQQAADVAVAHALAPRRRGHAGGEILVEVQRIGIGLAHVAIQPEREPVAQRARQLETGALAAAFVAVFGHAAVQGERAGQVAGGPSGDDVDHAAGRTGTVARRGGTAQHLDAFHRFGRHPVAVAAAVALAAAPHAHRIARADRAAVDQDQRVFRAHAADVDLAEVAIGAGSRVAGEVDARHAANDLGQVVGRRHAFQVHRGDHRRTQRLPRDLLGGDVHGVDVGRVGRFVGAGWSCGQRGQQQRGGKRMTAERLGAQRPPRAGITGHGKPLDRGERPLATA